MVSSISTFKGTPETDFRAARYANLHSDLDFELSSLIGVALLMESKYYQN